MSSRLLLPLEGLLGEVLKLVVIVVLSVVMFFMPLIGPRNSGDILSPVMTFTGSDADAGFSS